jgi:hypothetical protein
MFQPNSLLFQPENAKNPRTTSVKNSRVGNQDLRRAADATTFSSSVEPYERKTYKESSIS